MKIVLKSRDISGKKVKHLRKNGEVPASIYGPLRESVNLSVDPKEFQKVFSKAGYNKLVDVEIDGEKDPKKVLIKEVQMDPIKLDLIHVSLYEVDMNKSIVADIPVVVEGLSPAVKSNIGFLVTPVDNLSVRCLPKDLPSELVVNIDNLTRVGDAIRVSDITLPEGVEFAASVTPKTSLAVIVPPQKQIAQEEATVVAGAEDGAKTEEGAKASE